MSANKVNRVSSVDYVHRKIEESRHNETLAYLMFMAGVLFFVGGILETVITTENPDWFLFFPYKITSHAYSLLGLFMVLSGFMLLVSGIVLCVFYVFDSAFYLDQLKEVNVNKKNKELKIRAVDRGTKHFAKQLAHAHMELGECKKHLMNHMGLCENDSIYYCKLLGSRWSELATEKELYAHK
jgi:hypothetical protein